MGELVGELSKRRQNCHGLNLESLGITHPKTSESFPATSINMKSDLGGPTNWRPKGKPFMKPAGSEIAGDAVADIAVQVAIQPM